MRPGPWHVAALLATFALAGPPAGYVVFVVLATLVGFLAVGPLTILFGLFGAFALFKDGALLAVYALGTPPAAATAGVLAALFSGGARRSVRVTAAALTGLATSAGWSAFFLSGEILLVLAPAGAITAALFTLAADGFAARGRRPHSGAGRR